MVTWKEQDQEEFVLPNGLGSQAKHRIHLFVCLFVMAAHLLGYNLKSRGNRFQFCNWVVVGMRLKGENMWWSIQGSKPGGSWKLFLYTFYC